MKKGDFRLSHLYSRDYITIDWSWSKIKKSVSKNTPSILPFIDRKSLLDWKHLEKRFFIFLTDLEGKGSSKTWVETVVWFETNIDVGLLDLILKALILCIELLPELMVLLRETWLEKRIKGLELSFKNDWNASKSDQSGIVGQVSVFESGLALGEFSEDSLISSEVLKFRRLLLSLWSLWENRFDFRSDKFPLRSDKFRTIPVFEFLSYQK